MSDLAHGLAPKMKPIARKRSAIVCALDIGTSKIVCVIAKLKPRHTVPPYLYKSETIQRFRGRLRETFLSGDRATARVYLQNLVDHIVVGEDEITIEARANAALSMMAESRPTPVETTPGEVFADVACLARPVGFKPTTLGCEGRRETEGAPRT